MISTILSLWDSSLRWQDNSTIRNVLELEFIHSTLFTTVFISAITIPKTRVDSQQWSKRINDILLTTIR
jgi:hypothetical protein